MPDLPFVVPGAFRGRELEEIETLERLAADLRRYADGRLPTAAELREAPVVAGWLTVPDASGFRVAGEVFDHPLIGPGPATTSRVYAVDRSFRWMRAHSRLWRLGPPNVQVASRRRPGD